MLILESSGNVAFMTGDWWLLPLTASCSHWRLLGEQNQLFLRGEVMIIMRRVRKMGWGVLRRAGLLYILKGLEITLSMKYRLTTRMQRLTKT